MTQTLQGTKREDQAGVQNATNCTAVVDLAHRKLGHTTSNMDVDAHLAHLTVKEELTGTITKAIERIKIGSNENCIREDLAKEKMVFSQESSQAIFEMGNVALIELKTSRLRCPSCLHHVLKGTILCACGKHIRPDHEKIRRTTYQSRLQTRP